VSAQVASDAYDICFTQPRVLAAVDHVLQGHPFHSVGANSFVHAGWGVGNHQALHTDGHWSTAHHYLCCNSMWPLEDFTLHNGPTRLVPKSHLLHKQPAAVLQDPAAPHPDEILLLIPVGTVVIFNARVWQAFSRGAAGLISSLLAIALFYSGMDELRAPD
jgi:ectoine hydroxylase-related dioxygenase (phytanoyl-CoA dioxygenase family)